MAQTPEKKVKTWYVAQIRKRFPEAWVYNTHQGPYGLKGVPDVLQCIDGLFVSTEIKTDIGKLTPMQEHQNRKIEEAGGLSFTIYGKDELKLQEIVNAINEVQAIRRP